MIGAAQSSTVTTAQAVIATSIGRIRVVVTPGGLGRVDLLAGDGTATQATRRRRPVGSEETTTVLDRAVREIDEYLEGERRRFTVPLDLSGVPDFTRRVLDATGEIPYGEVRTYAEVAAAAGSPRGARAAGNALGSNPIPIVIPCHRIVRTSGALGGYTGGLPTKRRLLELEGCTVISSD